MKKQPVRSTADLARQLGVSRWTVSRVLNEQPGIGAATRQRVLAAVSRANFTPNPFARGLRGGRTGLVGVCLRELENLHLAGKLSAFEQQLTSRGLQMLIAINDGSVLAEEEAIRRFVSMRVEAVTLIASSQSQKSSGLLELRRSGIPFVLLDPIHPDLPHSISVDRKDAMHLAVSQLLKHAPKKMVAIGINPTMPYGMIRTEGLGRKIRHLFDPTVTQMDFHYGHQLGTLVAREKWPSFGIVALNDRIALGAMSALLDGGRKVPGEAAIVGYDNMAASEFFRPSLTTLDPRHEQLTAVASERLFRWMEKGEPDAKPILLATRLVVRESA